MRTPPRVTLATWVTLGRIAFLPVLWWWAIQGRAQWVGYGVMGSFLGDILDGVLARARNETTRLGSQLDSLADLLLLASSIAWLVVFRPEILRPPYSVMVAIGIGTWTVGAATGLLRFRRQIHLHLYSGKVSGVIGSLFIMDALAFGFHPAMFILAFAAFTFGNLEGLTVVLTRTEVDEHIGSIFRSRRARGSREGSRA